MEHWFGPRVGSGLACFWAAQSKLRVICLVWAKAQVRWVLKLEGNASGWFYRALTTSRFQQCTDNGSASLRPTMACWFVLQLDHHFKKNVVRNLLYTYNQSSTKWLIKLNYCNKHYMRFYKIIDHGLRSVS